MWLQTKNRSNQITGINVHFNNTSKEYELWATKTDGKTYLIESSKELETVSEIKQAIDYAIASGIPSFELEV
jgi:hypothetical protein